MNTVCLLLYAVLVTVDRVRLHERTATPHTCIAGVRNVPPPGAQVVPCDQRRSHKRARRTRRWQTDPLGKTSMQ